MNLEPVYQVAIQSMPTTPHHCWLYWNWEKLLSGFGAIAGGIGGVSAYVAVRRAKESIKLSKEAADINQKSADILGKQYEQQLDQIKPLIKFGNFGISKYEPVNPNLPGRKISNLSVVIENMRKNNFHSIKYIIALVLDEQVIHFARNTLPLQCSNVDSLTLQEHIEEKDSQLIKTDGAAIVLFLLSRDMTGLEAFSVLASSFALNLLLSAGGTSVGTTIFKDQNEINKIKIPVFKRVMEFPRDPEHGFYIEILGNDPDFKDYIDQINH